MNKQHHYEQALFSAKLPVYQFWISVQESMIIWDECIVRLDFAQCDRMLEL